MSISTFPSAITVLAAALVVGSPWEHGADDADRTALLDAQGDVEVWTIAHGANANDKSVDLLDADGNVLTTVAVAKAGSAAATASALAAAWNADAVAYAFASAAANSTTVTLTGTAPGRVFSVQDTSADSDTTYSNTQDATDDGYLEPGAPVLFSSVDGGTVVVAGGAAWAALQARVDTITVTYAASARYEAVVTFDGVEYRANTVAATDSATTADNLATALNAVLPANSVLATGNGDGTITLTGEIKGQPHTNVAVNLMTYAASAAISVTNTTQGQAVADVFVGVVFRDLTAETSAAGLPRYSGKRPIRVRTKGSIALQVEDTPNTGALYLGTGSSNAGKWYSSAGTDRAYVGAPGRNGNGAAFTITMDGTNPIRAYVKGVV